MVFVPVRLIKYEIGYTELRNFCKDCNHSEVNFKKILICKVSPKGVFPINAYGTCILYEKIKK